ncbi:MAG TPA: hypothetical protein VGE40_08405 [Bacilli bacterium]
MPERIREFKERGYIVHLMTGVSWGQYQEYLNGEVDGRNHWDEAQRNKYNNNIIHGTSEDIPYMVPTVAYSDFLTEKIRVAVDSGVEAIHLEEPEFWVEGGYSDSFKREWEIYYKEPWMPPHETVDAQYRASKLKAYLYTRCLDRLCGTLKEYAKVTYHRDLRFYVPTHSLINYTQWRIVSPESRLLDLPTIDGYIAQVWTGTSRTPNVYQGVRKERTFETAFLEYGIMQELVRGTDRRMWFLHDPIEDDPLHTWKDYRENYLKTVIASLLHPAVSRYEVAPWPNRIFNGQYPKEDGTGKETIPLDYATTLLTIMHTLGNMDQSDISWQGNQTAIGVLLADSAMFQRNHPELSDEVTSFKYDGTIGESAQGEEFMELLDWSPFYGLALPLLKHGFPVRPVQLDNVRRYSSYLDDYRLLVLSYEFMKPEYPDIHNAIAQWVRGGGALIYVGDESDDFHKVREWWNTGKRKYHSPAEHLFESLGLDLKPEEGIHRVGKGVAANLHLHPKQCALYKRDADAFREIVAKAAEVLDDPAVAAQAQNYLLLRRGPYVIVSVLDESVSEQPLEISGLYVDLFDPNLPVIEKAVIYPGKNGLWFDLHRLPATTSPQLIAASSRIELLQETSNGFSLDATGPENVKAAARIRCKQKPAKVNIANGTAFHATEFEWDARSRSVLIRYTNSPDRVTITIEW